MSVMLCSLKYGVASYPSSLVMGWFVPHTQVGVRRICGHNIWNNWAFWALGHNLGIISWYTGNKRILGPETVTRLLNMEVMASASASSSLSATSDPFNLESDIDSDTELTEESETTQNKTVVLLLDRLKSPTAADISRPRKTKKNDPPSL